MNDEHSNLVPAATSAALELVRAAQSHPKIQEAAGELGKAAVTLAKTVNNALLPIAAINFAFDKARVYFSSRFEADFVRVAGDIPVDELIEPSPVIAGPALQGLAFSHDQQSLRELYLALLAKASDRRAAHDVHPSFCEILKQLDPNEAALIRPLLASDSLIPIVALEAQIGDTYSARGLYRHLLNLLSDDRQEMVEDPKLPAMVDNWIRLGLARVQYDASLTRENAYAWVEKRPEYIRYSQQIDPSKEKIRVKKGLLERTYFGEQFARALNIIS